MILLLYGFKVDKFINHLSSKQKFTSELKRNGVTRKTTISWEMWSKITTPTDTHTFPISAPPYTKEQPYKNIICYRQQCISDDSLLQ